MEIEKTEKAVLILGVVVIIVGAVIAIFGPLIIEVIRNAHN
jgi:hypothetical protein